MGVVGLLLHFQWSWVALVAPDTDNGKWFIRTLTPLLTQSGICVAYSQSISGITTNNVVIRYESFLKERQVNVFLYYAETGSFIVGIGIIQQVVENLIKPKVGKIFITTAFWDISLDLRFSDLSFQHIQGLFSFSNQSIKRTNYNDFKMLFFTWQRLVEGGFHCAFPKPVLSVKGWTRCRERPQPLPWDVMERTLATDSYASHSAVQAVAQALHAASSSRLRRRVVEAGGSLEVPRVQPWQVLLSPPRQSGLLMGLGTRSEGSEMARIFQGNPVVNLPAQVLLSAPSKWLQGTQTIQQQPPRQGLGKGVKGVICTRVKGKKGAKEGAQKFPGI